MVLVSDEVLFLLLALVQMWLKKKCQLKRVRIIFHNLNFPWQVKNLAEFKSKKKAAMQKMA
jgi:hypothetical protein